MIDGIRPFTIPVDLGDWDELRRRLRATRWPDASPVPGWALGMPLGELQELCAYWADGYDWPARAASLNELPQLRTDIDGAVIHAVHVRSSRSDAIPLVLSHGWPGSFVEFADLVPLLVDPPPGEPAFDVVVPSLPGYGFSSAPDAGWGYPRIAAAWAELMSRLGYDRFGAAGSDWGTSISASLGQLFPDRVVGVHLIPPLAAPDPATFESLTPAEEQALADAASRSRDASAYGELQRTRPQTIGYALADSPAALAAWLVEKFWEWSDHDGDLFTVIPRDRILDDLMVYWLTRSGASAARLYAESIRDVQRVLETPGADPVHVPVGASVFPRESPRPSRRWAELRFSDIRHWGEPARGGHFAALEQPNLLAGELRAFFGGLSGGAARRP